jgi:oligo-1,6-glucosidase
MLLPDDEQVYAFTREHEGTRLLVVANLSSDDQVKPDLAAAGEDAAEWAGAEVVLTDTPGSAAAVDVPLGPWESRIYRLTAG